MHDSVRRRHQKYDSSWDREIFLLVIPFDVIAFQRCITLQCSLNTVQGYSFVGAFEIFQKLVSIILDNRSYYLNSLRKLAVSANSLKCLHDITLFATDTEDIRIC